VEFEILRGERTEDIPVTLGELPAEYAPLSAANSTEARLGFSVSTVNEQLAERYGIDKRLEGVVVTSIDQQGAAYEAGLREGDLISAVNRKRVGTRERFTRMVSRLEDQDTVLLRVYRESGGFYVAFRLK
jgi:serine protease Do